MKADKKKLDGSENDEQNQEVDIKLKLEDGDQVKLEVKLENG